MFGTFTEPELVPYQGMGPLPWRSLLVLAPHPDDEVFGCGGLLAAAVAQGLRCRVLVLTDGAAGGDPGQRERESRRAAAELGYGSDPLDLQFLGHPDRGLQPDAALLAALRAQARAVDADLLLAPSPFEIHPDHRAACVAAVALGRELNRPVLFYEVGQALMPNRLLDISALLPRKQAAMACFESQLSEQAYAEQVLALNRYRAYSLGPQASHAEGYWLLGPEQLQQSLAGVLDLARAGLQQRFDVAPGTTGPQVLPALAAPEVDQAVSVLIRSMDRDSLASALDSLGQQGVGDLEVLVLNAAGRPHRALPAPAWQGTLRLIEPDAPLDRAAAANRLLREAAHERVLFLDDDDVLLPGHLARLAAALDGEPAAVAAYADVDYGRWMAGVWHSEHLFAAPFDRWRLLFENYLPIHAVMFRRQPGLQFDERFAVFEDWDFWLQLAVRGSFVHVPGVGARYVAGATGNSGVFDAAARNESQRRALHAKWLASLSEEDASALLDYVRSQYQTREQALAQLRLAEQGHAATRAVLASREAELAELHRAAQDLRDVLAARDQEVANALREQDSVRAVLRARDKEIEALREQCDSLRAHADAKEAELNQLKALTPWQSFQAARRRTQSS